MNKKMISAALAAATVVATPAFAQDVQAGPATIAVNGPRAELIVGYDALRAFGEKEHGVLYGIGAGYDVAVGDSLSLGADVEASESSAKYGNQIVYMAAGRDLYAGARATLAISDKANVYLKGGYTNARFKASDGVNTESENLDGWRLGAGTEYVLTGKAYVGGEYRYSRYEGGDLKRHQVALTVGTRF